MSELSTGDALFSFYPLFARKPYLRRNVRKVIQQLTMGSTLSSRKSALKEMPPQEIMASEDEGEDELRPAKRRRIDPDSYSHSFQQNREPFGQVTNGSTRLMRRPGVVPPSDFYGRTKANGENGSVFLPSAKVPRRSRASLAMILPKEPYFFTESLRVDDIELIHTAGDHEVDFQMSENCNLPVDIDCRCSIAIFYGKNDEKPGDVEFKDYVEICRTNKFCTLRLDYEEDGQFSRKLILPEPFLFTPENFYVNRKKRKANGQFLSGKESHRTFGFADTYNLQISIDPPPDFDEHWPPVVIQSMGPPLRSNEERHTNRSISQALHQNTVERSDLYLFTSTKVFKESRNSAREESLQVRYKNIKQRVQYALRFNLDWALPSPFTRVNINLPKIESKRPPTTVLAVPTSPVFRPQERPSVTASPSDERAQRKRSTVPTYNLKALSAQAQGKSPRKSYLPRLSYEQGELEDGEISVKYAFNRAHAIEYSIKQETILSSFGCPICDCHNTSLDDLRTHLRTDHSAFKFILRKREPRVEFSIDLVQNRTGPRSIIDKQRTFTLGAPKSLFRLEEYLLGDDSWIVKRHGLHHNRLPERFLGRNINSSMSSSPHGSRQSSPNTSADLGDVEDLEDKCHQVLAMIERRTFRIPPITKPLYDSVTKQILQPGDLLSDGDSDVDETWLHHRKHDQLNEFVDVTTAEKEYLCRWNLFMVEQHLTSDKFLPQTVVRFVETNKAWLMETSSRKLEVMRHLEAFKLRNVLDIENYQKCFWIMKSVAQVAAADKGKGKGLEADVHMTGMETVTVCSTRREPTACICGEIPTFSERYVCRGQRCKARYFHRTCAEGLGRSLIGQWKCDECADRT